MNVNREGIRRTKTFLKNRQKQCARVRELRCVNVSVVHNCEWHSGVTSGGGISLDVATRNQCNHRNGFAIRVANVNFEMFS